MKTILCTLATILGFASLSVAQVSGNIHFTGVIVDQITSHTVQNAKIFVYRDDEESPFVLVYGDEDGNFDFRLDEGYKYTLQTKASKYISTKVVVEASNIPGSSGSKTYQASMAVSLIPSSANLPVAALEQLMEEPFATYSYSVKKGHLLPDEKSLDLKLDELNKIMASAKKLGSK